MSNVNFSFKASIQSQQFQAPGVNSKIADSLRNTANGLNNGCGADPLTKAMKNELNNLADMFDGGAGKCQHGRQNLNINMSFSGNSALARGISVSVGDPCHNKCGSKGGDPLGQNMLNPLNPLQMGAAALGFGAQAAMAPFAMLGNIFAGGMPGMPGGHGGNFSSKASIKMDGHGNGKAKFEFNDGNTKLKVKIKNCHGKIKIKIKMKQRRQVQNQQNINIKINSNSSSHAQNAGGNYSAQMSGSGSANGSSGSKGGDGLGIGSLAGMTFEQMVHKFMMKQAKEQQEKVKGMMEKMKAADSKGGDKKAGGAAGGKGGGKAGGAAGGKEGAGGAEGKGETSKAAQMEELKFEIQQLTQMMQALSGVNNTMHQNCMNAVRNIRA